MKVLAIPLVALLVFISSHRAFAVEPHGGTEAGSALKSPATIADIFSEVDKRLAALDQAVAKGDLHSVHKIAFEARDLLLATHQKATSLSDEGKNNLKKSLKKIRQQATLLDKYGDAGNARMTKIVLAKFKTEIRSIKMMMGTQQK